MADGERACFLHRVMASLGHCDSGDPRLEALAERHGDLVARGGVGRTGLWPWKGTQRGAGLLAEFERHVDPGVVEALDVSPPARFLASPVGGRGVGANLPAYDGVAAAVGVLRPQRSRVETRIQREQAGIR